MNTSTYDVDVQECESCGQDAQVTISYPDTTFRLCLRCVPAELRAQAEALPGLEDLVDEELQLLNEVHPAPAPGTTAGGL